MTDEEFLINIIHQDEAKVPNYTLPSALIDQQNRRVETAFDWMNSQRPYLLGLFEKYMYGVPPPRPDGMKFELLSQKDNALGNLALRKEVRIHLSMQNGKTHHLDILLYIPKNTVFPVPAFLGLNFYGNHATTMEKDIPLSTRWMRPTPSAGIVNHHASESSRGTSASSWPIETLMRRGYAFATLYYGDAYPDHSEGWQECIWRLFHNEPSPLQTAISAWAWGLSRALDFLESDPAIARGRVAVIGHSRLGKAALWAAAQDQRFGMTISNDSGSAGAALTRRRFGETIEVFPRFKVGFWCVPEFYKYAEREAELPVDQHMLISLLAPRPAYVASASEDWWADPRGEFLATAHASPVYRLFGSEGLGTEIMPQADHPIHADLGYHLRMGKHDITSIDWGWYLNFADRHWKKT